MHETPPSEDAARGYYDCSRRIRRLMQWVDEKRIFGCEKRNEMSLDESDVIRCWITLIQGVDIRSRRSVFRLHGC